MVNLKHSAAYLYRQYELATCINMFEPWEKKLINGFVLIMLTLVIFSSCVYLPSYMGSLLEVITPTSWPSSQPAGTGFMSQKMRSI
ncbi:CG34293 [Drosophila busckii]|uniref:Serine palmitoyltransferase small subunit B n=1 Tax=Drosophila busckii TaxID=30019 RepID=A0A0M4EQ59_DROBS|nr:serine palmitoyltransferase small subunit B [Drosophila busckii]ALC46397.1 CG34293 [Drosophila busckii]